MKIEEVRFAKDLKKFIDFPKRLYKDCAHYVPPLDSAEIKTLTQHPALDFCTLKMWLAYENDEVVGRIAGIINHKCNSIKEQQRVRFSWFDAVDDVAVAEALFQRVISWGAQNGMTEICGPSRFSNMEKQSMLVEGFDKTPPIGSDYNYPYYPQFLDTLGFEKEVDYIQYRINIAPVPESIEALADKVKERTQVKSRSLKNKHELHRIGHEFFQVINSSYKDVFNFIPLTNNEIDWVIEQNFSVVDPSFVSVLEDTHGKLVGIAFCMPSLSRAFQKAKGKLFPLGWLSIFHALKHGKEADLYLTGILPEYMHSGIHTIYHKELNEFFLQRGFKCAYSSQQLEHNPASRIWTKYDSEQIFRRRCYIKQI